MRPTAAGHASSPR